jgi:hypothetical protein
MAATGEAHYGDHVFIHAFSVDMRPYGLLTLPLSTEMLKTRNLMTTDAIESLARERWAAADRAFEIYDFGTTELEGACGWQCETPGTEMHRVFFLAADDRRVLEQVDRESASVRAHFVVRFKNTQSAEVLESYAITSHGGLFGISGNSG